MLVLLALAACGTQITPVRPWLKVDRGDVSGTTPADFPGESAVLVGTPISFAGGFAATCKHEGRELFYKNDSSPVLTSYSDCKTERTKVQLRCSGACIVDGTRVTATAPGSFTVTATLTSRKSHHVTKRTFVAELPESALTPDAFRLVCGGQDYDLADRRGVYCERPNGDLSVDVVAGGKVTKLPVTFLVGERTETGRSVQLETFFGAPLSAGSYKVWLFYGAMASEVTVIVPPTDFAAR